MTVTMDVTGDDGNGCIIFVARVSGMTKTGANAARQSAGENEISSGTPAPAFAASALTENPTLGFVTNNVNPATMMPPSGWTEHADTGYDSLTTGGEYVSRDSGFTGTTITWGSSTTDFGDIIVELDTSGAAADDLATKFLPVPEFSNAFGMLALSGG